mgnify:CR=1 FL=1
MSHKKEKNTSTLLLAVIIILLLIIAVWGFFLGKNMNSSNVIAPQIVAPEDITVTVIDDKRCTACQTSGLISQLKTLPALASATFEVKDFSDKWVEEFLTDNNIKVLPAIMFNTNAVDPGINTYLTPISSGEYSLQVGASFDPFAQRSDKGFLLLDIEKLNSIKKESYIKWNTDAKVTWIEYSDLECPYCAKLHNSDTPKELQEKYNDTMNIAFNHFPLTQIHKNAQIWAEILECVWEEKWSDTFYTLMETAFAEEKSTKSFLISEAVKLWANEENLNKCLDEWRYTDKVTNQMNTWNATFGVTGTPWNVLINNETWEYEVISWAYPTDAFETIIDKLLAE